MLYQLSYASPSRFLLRSITEPLATLNPPLETPGSTDTRSLRTHHGTEPKISIEPGREQTPTRVDESGRDALHNQSLELLAQELDDAVAGERRNDPYGEIPWREDVEKGGRKRLALPGASVKFPHQKVGIEEEDDEADLNGSAQKGHGAALRIPVFAGRHTLSYMT